MQFIASDHNSVKILASITLVIVLREFPCHFESIRLWNPHSWIYICLISEKDYSIYTVLGIITSLFHKFLEMRFDEFMNEYANFVVQLKPLEFVESNITFSEGMILLNRVIHYLINGFKQFLDQRFSFLLHY